MPQGQEAITVAMVIEAAQVVVSGLKAQLTENTATSKRAESDANEALGQFERSISLLAFEAARQKAQAATRAANEAEKIAATKARAIESERAKHIKHLQAEAARERATREAREYIRKVGTK